MVKPKHPAPAPISVDGQRIVCSETVSCSVTWKNDAPDHCKVPAGSSSRIAIIAAANCHRLDLKEDGFIVPRNEPVRCSYGQRTTDNGHFPPYP